LPDVIAGVATGGIAIGVLVAQELDCLSIYVRDPDHGRIPVSPSKEFVDSGQSVVVIDDMVATGNSSLKAVEALRRVGCDVERHRCNIQL